MKKILLIFAAAFASMAVSAQKVPAFKVSPAQFESNKTITTLSKGGMSEFEQLVAKQNKTVKPQAPVLAQDAQQSLRKAPRKVVEPKGEAKPYSFSGYVATWLGLMMADGIADQVVFDGKDVYVQSLFPAEYEELWAKGTMSVSAAGDTIVTFSKDLMIGEAEIYDDNYLPINVTLSVCECKLTEDGSDVTPVEDLVMTVKNGSLIVEDDVENPQRIVSLAAYQMGEYVGLLSYGYCSQLDPVTIPLNLVEIPASATVSQYVFDFTDINLAPVCTLGSVAVDGNDYYFTNLGFNGTVKGTKKDGKIHVSLGQYLGIQTYYLFNSAIKTNWEYDEETWELIYDNLDELVLTYDEETKIYTVEGESVVSVAVNLSGLTTDGGGGIAVSPFQGLKAATPADPSSVTVEYYEDYGQYFIMGNVINKDVDGNYIEPKNMELAIIADGEPIEFTPEDGYYITESITWMPYGWTDDQGGYDISFASTQPYLYIYDGLFEKLGMQVRYTCDGVTQYSNIVYPTEETGIATALVPEDKPFTGFYDLQGRISRQAKGIVIKNGKKLMVK